MTVRLSKERGEPVQAVAEPENVFVTVERSIVDVVLVEPQAAWSLRMTETQARALAECLAALGYGTP